jgi:hypothetical protein
MATTSTCQPLGLPELFPLSTPVRLQLSLDGALSADYSDLAKQYQTLADQLEYQGKTNGASVGILAGGITKTQVENVRANTNRIEGSFRRDRFKNPPSYQTPEYE